LATIVLSIMCNHPSHSINPTLENRRQFRRRKSLQKFSNTFHNSSGSVRLRPARTVLIRSNGQKSDGTKSGLSGGGIGSS
jgi:hypothetical protein